MNQPEIPKTFYLTHSYHTTLVDKRIDKIKSLYPEFDIKFYDNNACIKFLESNYPNNYVKTFLKLKKGAHKADFFRYCALYKNGGLYIDLDNILQKNIWSLVSKYNFTTCLHGGKNRAYRDDLKYNKKSIHQGFIAAEPNFFILKHLIEHMISNPVPHKTEFAPFQYHFYVRYFYKYLLDLGKVKELLPSTEYLIKEKKIFLIDTKDTAIMKYGIKK